MTKDEQIGHLFDALETIAYGHVHSTGEDAEDMRDEAREAVAIWRAAVQPSSTPDGADRGRCGHMAEDGHFCTQIGDVVQ